MSVLRRAISGSAGSRRRQLSLSSISDAEVASIPGTNTRWDPQGMNLDEHFWRTRQKIFSPEAHKTGGG